MEMQRLNAGMMARYEIADRRPVRVNAVQFGMSEALLGTVDRLIDDYTAASEPDARIGFAAVEAGGTGFAGRLSEQDGMYTILIRGYVREEPVKREQVVQCILRAVDPDADPNALRTLALDPGILTGFVDDAPGARALAARFLELRRGAGLPDPVLFRLGNADSDPDAAQHPTLADSLAFRAEPDEAARQCAEMNYLDDMLYIAEPCARLTLAAPEGFARRFPLSRAAGICLSDAPGAALAARLKAQLFDGGIFLMAAAGWLNGCDTLRDCMANERLRRFVGEGFVRELMPALADADRPAVEACVVESFERFENPLNRNRILRAAENLTDRFVRGPLRPLRALAEEHFEPPRALSFALAATIMLYAGARKDPGSGVWEVARGRHTEAIHDDPDRLARFAALSHDMDPESLAYAALADRELWQGRDLREIDGLMARVALDIAAIQRRPDFLPEPE
ncbi:MAG: hypothetical protein IJJ45_08535 [Clostridia bacterium]|nr:hypothetical protein [Clostridia bacterium]